MKGDQFRSCIPHPVLSADGIRIDLFGCRRKTFRLLCGLLPHCQKAAGTFTEARLILSTMIILPNQVLYYNGIGNQYD